MADGRDDGGAPRPTPRERAQACLCSAALMDCWHGVSEASGEAEMAADFARRAGEGRQFALLLLEASP